MTGDPNYPISFERAIQAVCFRLGFNAGLDIRALQLAEEEPAPSPEAEALRKEQEEQAQAHYGEAEIRVVGLVIVGELRAWTAHGDDWKRPTPEALQKRIYRADDQPWELYVDSQELAAKFASRWSSEFAEFDAGHAPLPYDAKTEIGRVGRPTGSGSYAEDDAPLLIEMEELLDTRAVVSEHAASLKVAHKARGYGTIENKADRLRRGYSRKRRLRE